MNTLKLIDSFKKPIGDRVREALRLDMLTEAQWQVISALSKYQYLVASDLSEKSGILGPSVSRILKILFADGLIKLDIDDGDLRFVQVSLTLTGSRMHNRLVNGVEKAMTPSKSEAKIYCKAIMKLSK